MEQQEADARRLLERTDVAEARVVGDFIEVTNSEGETRMVSSFSEALSWLLGADEHLVGMAICPCFKCLTR